MKYTLPLLLLFLFGCAPSDDDIRKIVHEEIQNAAKAKFYTNPQTSAPSSVAVQVGSLLFISSQASEDLETTEFLDGTIEQQTRQVLNNIMSILRNAGYDSTQVVSCTVYLKDMNDFPKMNLIYGGYFDENHYPARTVVAVSDLRKRARIEISAIAWKPSTL